MAELTSTERLQPALLDRLTDDRPDASSEPRRRRVVSNRQLRDGVLRDLRSLLNACRVDRIGARAAYPLLEESVLNYGLPDLTGRCLSNLDEREIADQIAQTILRFEPRIRARSLRVTPIAGELHGRLNAMAFLIEGEMWAQPYPEQLYLKTELDLEDGQVTVMAGLDGGTI